MGVYEELQARGLIAQVTNEEEIRKMVNEGKAVFYIGFDPTADSPLSSPFGKMCEFAIEKAGKMCVHLLKGRRLL